MISSTIPEYCYTAAGTRELDQIAINTYGIPGHVLMERAGQVIFDLFQLKWIEAKELHIFAGAGNNAGDGFIVARLAAKLGYVVQVYMIGDETKLGGDALNNFSLLSELKVTITKTIPQHIHQGVIIDALLGTGLKGQAEGIWFEAITCINSSTLPVISVDVPSGLSADTGRPLGAAVKAAATVSFIGLKQGLFTAAARDYIGELYFDDLGLPASAYQHVAPSAKRLTHQNIQVLLPVRPKSAHKGLFGHVLIVGGNKGMSGAVRLSAHAALKTGAGLVTIATHKKHADLVNLSMPEVMSCAVDDKKAFQRAINSATVMVVGPGLGTDKWAKQAFAQVVAAKKPIIIDADALNLLSTYKNTYASNQWVLTPHPGEAARLLGDTTDAVQTDRFAALRTLCAHYHSVVVLKGSGTLIGDTSNKTFICDYSHPAFATAGMGDALTGVIAALVAQGMPLIEAAKCGTFLHAMAGITAAGNTDRGLLATELIEHLPIVFQSNFLLD